MTDSILLQETCATHLNLYYHLMHSRLHRVWEPCLHIRLWLLPWKSYTQTYICTENINFYLWVFKWPFTAQTAWKIKQSLAVSYRLFMDFKQRLNSCKSEDMLRIEIHQHCANVISREAIATQIDVFGLDSSHRLEWCAHQEWDIAWGGGGFN